MTKPQDEEKQAKAMEEFKEKANLLERDKDDLSVHRRFLKARQYNVDKAVTMYDAYAKWRKENDVDTVLDTPFAVDKNLWKHSFHGRDKEGRPVFVEPTGILDIKSIVSKGYKMDTLIRAHIYQQEYMAKLTEEATKKEGRPIEQTLSILDLEGAGVWMHLNGTAREFFSILAGLAQNYYPERLYKLVVVNAPRAFPMAWNFIRPFLDIHTQNKIFIPSHKDQYKVLSELIDPVFIPKKFGGQCDCEARGCLTHVNPPVFADALRYDEGNWQPTTEVAVARLNEKEVSHSDIRAGNMKFDEIEGEGEGEGEEGKGEDQNKNKEDSETEKTQEKVKDLSIS